MIVSGFFRLIDSSFLIENLGDFGHYSIKRRCDFLWNPFVTWKWIGCDNWIVSEESSSTCCCTATDSGSSCIGASGRAYGGYSTYTVIVAGRIITRWTVVSRHTASSTATTATTATSTVCRRDYDYRGYNYRSARYERKVREGIGWKTQNPAIARSSSDGSPSQTIFASENGIREIARHSGDAQCDHLIEIHLNPERIGSDLQNLLDIHA